MTSQEPSQQQPPETIATWKIIVAVAAVGLALYLILSLSSDPETFEINGFTFSETQCPSTGDTCWQTTVVTNVGVHPITFYSDPREVRDIPVSQESVVSILNLTTSRNTSVTIAFDEGVPGEVGVAATLIARVTGERLYNISTRGAVYGRDVTCDDSTGQDRVVYLRQGERDGAYLSQDCVILSAMSTDSLREVVDAYTMHLLLIL